MGQFVKLVQLGLKQLLVRQPGLVLRDERGRHRAAQRVFDDFVILRGTEQNADRRLLMRLLHIAVERLQFIFEDLDGLGVQFCQRC